MRVRGIAPLFLSFLLLLHLLHLLLQLLLSQHTLLLKPDPLSLLLLVLLLPLLLGLLCLQCCGGSRGVWVGTLRKLGRPMRP